MTPRQTEFVGPIPRAVLRVALARAGMVGICVACVGLVYWSLTMRLQPVNKEMRDRALELSRLGDELEDLRLRVKPETVADTKAQYQAAQETLFDRPEQFRAWQSQLRRKGAVLELETKINLDTTQMVASAEAKLAQTRAAVEITPRSGGGLATNGPAYHRLLKFAQALTGAERRADLVELLVEGNANSVQRAEAVLLLATKPEKAK